MDTGLNYSSLAPTQWCVSPTKKDTIIFHRQDGTKSLVSIHDWANFVLRGMILGLWDSPGELRRLVKTALANGFASAAQGGARHLYEAHKSNISDAVLFADVLFTMGHTKDAKRILDRFHPMCASSETAMELIARIQKSEGETKAAMASINKALICSPNNPKVFETWVNMISELGGDVRSEMEKACLIPGAWRPKLHIAKEMFSCRNGAEAVAACRTVVAIAKERRSLAAALAEVGETMGINGYLIELLDVVGAAFNPQNHGLTPARNLVRANVDLGQFYAAKEIIERLYDYASPEERPILFAWSIEIAKRTNDLATEERNTAVAAGNVHFIAIPSPIWASDEIEICLPNKEYDAPVYAFLNPTIETKQKGGSLRVNDIHLRTGPVFWADAVACLSTAKTIIIEPWILGEAGCALTGAMPWKAETATAIARDFASADFCITTHIKFTATKSDLTICIYEVSTANKLLEASVSQNKNAQGGCLCNILEVLLNHVAETTGTPCSRQVEFYQTPTQKKANQYAGMLSDLLSLRCKENSSSDMIYETGERELLFQQISICESNPKSVLYRVVLSKMLASVKRRSPKVAAELESAVIKLQRAHPVSGTFGAAIGQSIARTISDCAVA